MRSSSSVKSASVDVSAFVQQMSASLQELLQHAKDNDPAELRHQIADLRRQIAKSAAVQPVEKVFVPVVSDDDLRKLAEVSGQIDAALAALRHGLASLPDMIAHLDQIADRVQQASKGTAPSKRDRPVIQPTAGLDVSAHVSHTPTERVSSFADNGKLLKAERAILTVLAQHGELSHVQVALLTGYASNGGGFNNAVSALRSRGHVAGDKAQLSVTQSGVTALGKYDRLPEGQDLRDYWLTRVGRAERGILLALFDVYPRRLRKSEIAEAAGRAVDRDSYDHQGGGFNNALSRLTTLNLIKKRGSGDSAEYCASETLFE
jgi:hypothetical protein